MTGYQQPAVYTIYCKITAGKYEATLPVEKYPQDESSSTYITIWAALRDVHYIVELGAGLPDPPLAQVERLVVQYQHIEETGVYKPIVPVSFSQWE